MATKFDIKNLQSEAQLAAQRNFYAYVGAADLAVETLRDAVSDAQQRLSAVQDEWVSRMTDLQKGAADLDAKSLRAQAAQAFEVVTERIESFTADAKVRREAVEKRVAELQAAQKALPARVQKLVDENVTQATEAYEDLAKRGESLVGRIRRQQSTQEAVKAAKTTVSKAKTTKTQAAKTAKATKVAPAAKKRAATTRSSAKATATSARKTAAKAAQAVVDAAEKVGD